jgi:hypothetical protein
MLSNSILTEDFENGSHDFRKSDFTPLYGLNSAFVLAKLHQLYELNKKPGVSSELYMEIFILKKIQKMDELFWGVMFERIFKENTTLQNVDIYDIEKKVNEAMVKIIKSGNRNRKKIAQDICKHPDLPNYQPYLPYCPNTKH